MQPIDISKLVSGQVDIWAILVVIIAVSRKLYPAIKAVPPFLKEKIETDKSHLECMKRIESGIDRVALKIDRSNEHLIKIDDKLSRASTKDDIYSMKESILIDKLNGSSNGVSHV